jgi:hypothetical protein
MRVKDRKLIDQDASTIPRKKKEPAEKRMGGMLFFFSDWHVKRKVNATTVIEGE